ncbi:hypothetical protein Trydic_g20920 [Trypoxylus dichotomus]
MQDFDSADIEESNKDNLDEYNENCTILDYSDNSEIECGAYRLEGLSKNKISQLEAICIFSKGLEWSDQNNANIEDILPTRITLA